MTVPVFLVDRARLVDADRICLDGPEGRHAATIRRLRPGERIDLTDGAGLVAECRVTSAGRDELELDVVAYRELARPQPRLTVVQAVPKGERGELAVEMLTEVGVDVIVPWSAARCVTVWRAERGTRSLAKWRSTAREAAKQARRAWLPDVTELADTAQVAARLTAATLGLVLHEAEEQPIGTLDPLPGAGEIVLVVGPEGGITEDELAVFAAAGAHRCRLGPTVLRTSTAGVAAAAAVLSRTARWSGPPQ
ncbi:MAG: 16S rRNA (uracil(1498)-N(3))-methyltransferase [Actinomycetes bacterium]|nr:16S rRNA (uracil(1498)-N(3))-methyltransferase [Actinomycetes bacterium]